jgi:hypothetical protein
MVFHFLFVKVSIRSVGYERVEASRAVHDRIKATHLPSPARLESFLELADESSDAELVLS